MNKTKCKATLLIGALIISSLAASGIGAAQTILEEYNAIRSIVLSLNLPKGAEISILAKLDASKESYLKSNFIAAMNQLVALENYLNAQKGKHIPEQVAEQLLSRVINLREMIWLGGIQIIKIGVTYNHDYQDAQAIADIARTDINAWLEANRSPYRVDFFLKDNQDSDEVALQNLVEFNQAGINLVNGHGLSWQCQYSMQYINDNNMILFSHSSTSPSLAYTDNLFRLTTNDYVQGKVLVDLYEYHQKKAVIILYRDDVWGSGLADVIRTQCNERGIEVLSFTPYNPSYVDWAPTLADMEAILALTTYPMEEIGFEIVFSSEAVQALQCLSEGDYPLLIGVDWYGSDGTAMSDDIANNVFSIASQVKLYSTMVAPVWDDPKFTSFSDRYRSLFGAGPGFYQAARYDILRILADYVILEGTTATDAIKPHLETLTGYNGVSGISTLDENGDRIGANYDIWGYGYDGNNYGSVRFGYYDLATDTITMFPMPEPPF